MMGFQVFGRTGLKVAHLWLSRVTLFSFSLSMRIVDRKRVRQFVSRSKNPSLQGTVANAQNLARVGGGQPSYGAESSLCRELQNSCYHGARETLVRWARPISSFFDVEHLFFP
jgi:hypothetical protein